MFKSTGEVRPPENTIECDSAPGSVIGNELMDLEKIAWSRQKHTIGLGQKLNRILSIARYYRWSQMARRGFKLISQKARLRKTIGPIHVRPIRKDSKNWGRCTEIARAVLLSHRNHISHSQSDFSQGRLVLLCDERILGNPICWDLSGLKKPPSHLWRFQLHYHEFLLSYIADIIDNCEPDDTWNVVFTIVESWLDEHPPKATSIHSDAWHPYCIARRIPVWIWILSLSKPSPIVEARILASLSQQANYLASHLEKDIGGNHLLENLTALALIDAAFPSAESNERLQHTLRFLEAELGRQLLPHGEHFERTPAYHCQVLANVLKVICVIQPVENQHLSQLKKHANAMLGFLCGILHEDNEIPLFSDSVFYESASVSQIRDLVKIAGLNWPQVPASKSSQVGPYHVFRSKKTTESGVTHSVIFDAGDVGARELPAHAHCDLLGFEASICGERWIVDSGNFDYEASSMRAYCRSSLAHNVVTANGQDNCEVWGKFRMGRRGRIIESRHGKNGEYSWAYGSHDAYRDLGLGQMSRLLAVDGDGQILVADWLRHAKQSHANLTGTIHLAPEIIITKDSSSEGRFTLTKGGARRTLSFFGIQNVCVANGWYCPAFGLRQRQSVFVYSKNTDCLIPFGWQLGEVGRTDVVTVAEDCIVVLDSMNSSQKLEWKY